MADPSNKSSDKSTKEKPTFFKPSTLKSWDFLASTKYDMEKFIGKNDFSLWRVKIQALLVQKGTLEALDGEVNLPASMTEEDKRLVLCKALDTLILSLGDKPLGEVEKEKTAKQIWDKLKYVYMVKSFQNRLYLK